MSFSKGQSGNPNGRPAGKTPATQLKKVIAENMPDILEVMINQAKEGDIMAAKALMDKVVPSVKPQSLAVNIETIGTLTEQGYSVITETLKGSIAPDTASTLITMLSNQSKLIEMDELIQRIEALENIK